MAADPKFPGEIKWNFEKFLIAKDGTIDARYRSKVTPMSDEVTKAVEQALEIDPRLLQRGDANGTLVQGSQPNDPMMQFRLAKLLAARGDADTAVAYLDKAVDAGFKDAAAIQNDAAFAALARDERFAQLLERARRR